MKTVKDAIGVCQGENDNFYLTAFMIEAWLGEVTLGTVAEYAERRKAKTANSSRERQELSDLFEPEKVAHLFRCAPPETEDEKAAGEKGMKLVEA